MQRGYESGGFPARPYGGAATFIPYNPTFATNFETGLKGVLADLLRFDTAVFYTRYDDLALSVNEVTPAGFTTLTVNAGRSRTYGAEFDGSLPLGTLFSVNSSVGYNNARVTEVSPGTVGVVAGDTPALTPAWTASLGPQLSFDLANGANLTARTDLSYRSSMYGQSANDAYNRIGSRFLTNFNVSYFIPGKKITLSLYGNNIFDRVYDEARIDQYAAGINEIIRSNDRSEFGIKLKKSFF